MQVVPSAHLRTHIKHYLWLDKVSSLEEQLRIFGDGNPGIVFCCEGRLYMDARHEVPYPEVFGYGQVSQFREIYAPGAVKLLIVVLQPFALAALTGIAAWECRDELLQPREIFDDSAYDGVLAANFVMEIIARIEAILSTTFDTALNAPTALVTACIDRIRETKGPVSSQDLERFSGYSERRLEQLFKQHVGLSPKKFVRITRLLQYIKQLRTAPSLTDCAYESGYYDQAHLNHEFKGITGITPTQYKIQTHALALNFFGFLQSPAPRPE